MMGNGRTWGSLQSMLYHKMEPQALDNFEIPPINTTGRHVACVALQEFNVVPLTVRNTVFQNFACSRNQIMLPINQCIDQAE